MPTPTSRATLRDYALRKLGFPVITINVDDDQLDDRIDEAIELYRQFHYDATTIRYMSVSVSANANTDAYGNRCFPMPNTIIGISRVFPIQGAQSGGMASSEFNIFDLNYQLRLNELYDFTSADYVYFELAQQHIRTLEMLFIGEPPFRYNRHDNNLYIDMKYANYTPGAKLVLETYSVLPENNTGFWNDVWLKKYVTCLFKEQWGSNLKKFTGVKLPGDVMLNGQQIYDEAIAEKKELEVEIREMYEEPPTFLVG